VRAGRPCPACDARSSTLAFEVEGYVHRRCRECRSLFVDPLPSDEQLEKVYAATDYYASAERHEPRIRREASERAHALAALGVRTVLDVGCAAGFFLDAARKAGLEATGVEPGPSGDRARTSGHFVVRGTLADAHELGSFDAVTLWEVLEHVGNPLALLEQALVHLNPTGVLALSTPSVSGLQGRILGKRFPMVTPPEHLSLFSRTGLERLLRRAGLQGFRTTSFSNLGEEELRSGLRRFVFGDSPLGERAARLLARSGLGVANLVDRVGLGSELEIHARRH
jgi:SAM-dependent methyltransferase